MVHLDRWLGDQGVSEGESSISSLSHMQWYKYIYKWTTFVWSHANNASSSGTIHNLLPREGICRGITISPKPLGAHIFEQTHWGDIHFFDKIFMIFSYFNFLKELKMMFRHCLGNVLRYTIKIYMGDINFSPKPLGGHAFFNKTIRGASYFRQPKNLKPPPPQQ